MTSGGDILSEGCCFLFVTVATALFTFMLLNRKRIVKCISNFYHWDKKKYVSSTLCASPGCIRCNKYEHAQSKARERLEMYFDINQPEPNQKTLERIHEALMTVGNGKKYELDNQCPNVLYVKRLMAKPLWQDRDFEDDTNILESNANTIYDEFENVFANIIGWVCNETPTGKWFVFHLVNQGVRVEDNCKRCPQTVSILKALPSFMGSNLLGNASFSVVYPGTEIAEHFGPTNIRIRTHLGLVIPPGCELQVGGQKVNWKENKCTIFDDSFSHSVKHLSVGDGSRVVFMADLWHPELTMEERIALDFIYSPDL